MKKSLKLKSTAEKKSIKKKGKALPNGVTFDLIDEAAKESFPSSDPPAWTLGLSYEVDGHVTEKGFNVTQILSQEHHSIRKVIAAMGKLIDAIHESKRIHQTLFKNLSLFLHDVVDHCLYQKEKILFRELKKHGEEGRPSNYLLNDLIHEHEHERALLADLDKLSKNYTVKNAVENENLISILKQIQHVYLNHMDKEEEYILPFINKSLSKDDQRELLDQFDRVKSITKHEKLIKLAEKLEAKLNKQ